MRQLTPDEKEWYDRIRAIAISNMPYIPDIAYLFIPVMVDELGTFACDSSGRIYLSRQGWAGTWTEEEAAWAFIHECLHILHGHAGRRTDDMDHDQWNIAADIEINDSIETIGRLRALDNINTSRSNRFVRNKTAETYYKLLGKKPGAGTGECGGVKSVGEAADPMIGMPSGRSVFDIDIAVESAATRIADAEKNNPGSVPGAIARIAEDIRRPAQIDWFRHLGNIVLRAARTIIAGSHDSSFRRPSRRLSSDEFVLPGRRAYSAHIGVLIDTSGSMGHDDLTKAIVELIGIAKVPSVDMSFMFYDRRGSELFDGSGDIAAVVKQKMRGGGGTDMGAGIDVLVAHMVAAKKPPHLVVVLTDGYTDWNRSYRGPVIAGIIGDGDAAPSDITTIHIK